VNWLAEAVVYLGAAVVSVPVAKRLGLGSVLGYVVAGIIIGPDCLGVISSPQSVLTAAQVGVVMLLFIIGLQLQPARLRVLRRTAFGMGTTQVAATTAILAGIGIVAGMNWGAALVVGFGLSLSSTAFALQLLAERQALFSPHGRAGFAILLFQDLVAIPVLVLLPFLNGAAVGEAGIAQGFIRAAAMVVAFVIVMRFGLRSLLRVIAATRLHELFTMVSLLLVLGSALAMRAAGLSMGLGAFMAGVLVADSQYRHQLESDIEPFKGLLLALFFIAVGMSADLDLLWRQPLLIVGAALLLVAVKTVVLLAAAPRFGLRRHDSVALALYLSQGGEFGFIVFGMAAASGLIPAQTRAALVLIITISMVLTPVLVALAGQVTRRMRAAETAPVYDEIKVADRGVIIAGFGRFGQVISRVLRSQHIPFTAIEIDPGHVDFVRKFGNKVFYGDAGNLRLLRAAGIDKSGILVLAIGQVEKSVAIAEMVKRNYPDIRLFARARNRLHEMRLRALGCEKIIRDTLLSSVDLAGDILVALGQSPERSAVVKRTFLESDRATLDKQYAIREDERALIQTTKEAAKQLERIFAADEESTGDGAAGS
jgi:glutathione-regulated potassium-efflux system ancillary protein KefC/glutathione-regulated potassium-efflux system protein KefB